MKYILVALTLGLVACGRDAPPAPVAPPQAKTRTVELRYWMASYGNASELPATAPVITVVLQPVGLGPTGWPQRLPPQPLLRVQDVSMVARTVRLPEVTTYPPMSFPRLDATVTVDAVPPVGPGRGYYVIGQYTVDGIVDTTRALYYTAQHSTSWESPLSHTVEYRLLP